MLWWITQALAGGTVLAVFPGAPVDDPSLRAAVVRALTDAGYEQATLVAPETFVADLHIVSLPAPPRCQQPTESWKIGIDAAYDALNQDIWEEADALADALERDLNCLSTPPEAADLRRLWLLRASLTTIATQEGLNFGDPIASVRQAAPFWDDNAPEVLDPELITRLIATQKIQGKAQMVIEGSGWKQQSRFNGDILPIQTVLDIPAGKNWLWATSNESVEHVGSFQVQKGEKILLWAGSMPQSAQSLIDAVAALKSGEPSLEDQQLLVAAAALQTEAVVYLSAAFGRVSVWRPEGDHLLKVELHPTTPTEARPLGIDHYRAAYGLALSGGWSNQSMVQGMGGGLGVYANWPINPQFNFAFSAMTLMVSAPGGLNGGAPVRWGLHYGRSTAKWVGSFGVDAGFNWLGAFTPDAFSPIVGASAGASGAISTQTGVRVEAWGAAGLDHSLFGLWLGIESRLRPRTELQ